MIDLEIIDVQNTIFQLMDNNGNIYTLMFEFYNVNYPVVGDIITLNKNLLDVKYKGFAQPYAFLSVDKNDYDKTNVEDFAFLKSNNKNYFLRRIYG